jgi:hypothetical protein
MHRLKIGRLSFLPIPALAVLIAAIHFTIDPSLFFEPAWLLPVANTLFVTVVGMVTAWIVLRDYLATGRIQILLLGCGVLSFGIGGILAALMATADEPAERGRASLTKELEKSSPRVVGEKSQTPSPASGPG